MKYVAPVVNGLMYAVSSIKVDVWFSNFTFCHSPVRAGDTKVTLVLPDEYILKLNVAPGVPLASKVTENGEFAGIELENGLEDTLG
jgi:hypothetical protein